MVTIKKFVVLGTEIILPESVDIESKDHALSLVRDFNPTVSEQLEQATYQTKTESGSYIFYRDDATFG